ncbi:MAG TPA: hypothetical protein VFS43_25435 [Polyangiaceae bacterium]|nr:hypothetical protein [Polyangiaceae bacterium]
MKNSITLSLILVGSLAALSGCTATGEDAADGATGAGAPAEAAAAHGIAEAGPQDEALLPGGARSKEELQEQIRLPGQRAADLGESPPDGVNDVAAEAESRPEQQASDEERAALEGAVPDVPTDDAAACGKTGPNLDTKIVADAASPNSANQRSGSSTGCAAVGVLQPTDDADYYCYTAGNDGFTWTYLSNRRTGVRGWVRDDLLRDNGSFKWCGF